jgi:maleate cis-trans isomerase
LILPANNTVAEPEMASHAPAGVSFHATRVLARGSRVQERVGVLAEGVPAARDALRDSRVDAMVYGCMMSCLAKGGAWEAELSGRLAAPQTPFQTAGRALLWALEALGARQASVFSPYSDEVSAWIPGYLAGAGVNVTTNVNYARLADPHAVVAAHPERLFRAIAALPHADVLCVLATDFPTFRIIERLEQAWGGPVVSSNSAVFFWLMRAAGVREAIAGLGALGRRVAA